MLPGLLLASLLAGCGGGAGTSGGGGGVTPLNVPTLTAIAPSGAAAGAASITLSLYGSNFENDATVQWNGSRLLSTWKSAARMTATIPAANLAAAGSAEVTVTNPGGGRSSAGTFTISAARAPTTWVRKVAEVDTGDNTTPDSARNIVWDAANGRLYYANPSTTTVAPNTVAVIDPVAGAVVKSVAAGNDPDLLSISSDSSYLWVGLDGDHAVQRFLLPGLTKDISFPVPTDSSGNPQQPVSLQAAPVSPHTLALVAGKGNYAPAGNGIYVFDDAVVRPDSFSGHVPNGPTLEWIQWGKNDSTIYGTQYSFSFLTGVATLNVTSSGVSYSDYRGGAMMYMGSTQYNSTKGLLYSYALALNPVDGSVAGLFNLSPAPLNIAFGSKTCTSDASLGRYYCVEDDVGSDRYELLVFDLNTYAMLDRIYLGTPSGQPVSLVTGLPHHLVRWGNAGLALTTKTYGGLGDGGFYLIDGAAINPNAAADVSSGEATWSYSWMSSLIPQQATAGSVDLDLTITGRNFTPNSTACWNYSYFDCQFLPTYYVSAQQLNVTIPAGFLASPGQFSIGVYDTSSDLLSTNGLIFTVTSPPTSGSTQVKAINLTGFALAWDAHSGRLYVGTADFDSAYPNSIVAIDGETGSIVKAQTVSPNPDVISVSGDGKYLYAGFAYATTMTQLQLPELGSPLTWALKNPASSQVYWAGDLAAAPVNAHTTAVTLFNKYLNPPWVGGLVIYDDNLERPDFLGGWGSAPGVYWTLAWSSSDEILAAASTSGPLFGIQISPSGAALLGTGTDNSFNTGYAQIHSDFGTGLIYSDNGNVADPTTQATVGTYNASGLVVPDSSLNRVFILGQTAAQANTSNYTIQSFDQMAYTPVASITVQNLYGSPIEFARWGTSGLAVLTLGRPESGLPGILYLVRDADFVSSAPGAAFQLSKAQELVRRRWKHISKADIVKMVQTKRAAKLP